MGKVLSEIPSMGRVAVCGRCEQVHVKFGRVTLDLSREEFADLSRMLAEAESRMWAEGSQAELCGPALRGAAGAKLSVVH